MVCVYVRIHTHLLGHPAAAAFPEPFHRGQRGQICVAGAGGGGGDGGRGATVGEGGLDRADGEGVGVRGRALVSHLRIG